MKLEIDKDELMFLASLLERIFGHRRPAVALEIHAGPVTLQGSNNGPAERPRFMLLLKDDQKCRLSVSPVDKKGKPAKVEGAPAWSSSDETVATVVPAADGMSADVVAGNPGICQINVSADADLGEGVKTISGTLDVTIEAGEAVGLAISTGTPEPQEPVTE